MKNKIITAVIGTGSWGQKIISVVYKYTSLKYCCNNSNFVALRKIKSSYPKINPTQKINDIIEDSSVDAVFIATPISTHYNIARKFLERGKKIFLEKPMADSSKDAKKLVDLEKKGSFIFVGNIFLYSKIFRKLKSIADSDPIKNANFVWMKYGTFKENIVDNLLSHDISIIQALTKNQDFRRLEILKHKEPLMLNNSLQLRLYYDNFYAGFYLDRVSPIKTKISTFYTRSGRVVAWKDNELFERKKGKGFIRIAKENKKEPLENEVKEFIDCLKSGKKPLSNASFAYDTVIQLEKIKKRLEH